MKREDINTESGRPSEQLPLTIPDVLTDRYLHSPEQTAFLFEKNRQTVSFTYRQVYEDVSRTAEVYRVLSGKRVGIIGSNSYSWILSAWALLSVGAVTAFLDPTIPSEDLKVIIRRSDLTVLVYDEQYRDFCAGLSEDLPEIQCIPFPKEEESVRSDRSDQSDQGPVMSGLSAGSKLCAGAACPDAEALFFTSGTTKSSKIVVTPVSAILGNSHVTYSRLQLSGDETMFIPLPLHHSFGFARMLIYFTKGHPVFVSSMMRMLKDLRKCQPQVFVTVPSALEFLLKKKDVFSSMKLVHVSGAYCPPELAAKVRALGPSVQNEYGSSEIPGGIGINRAEDEVDTITLMPGKSAEVSPEGELIITSPYHLKEYYRDPEETGQILDSLGRIHTGDVGYIDPEGRIHVQGRRKDMIMMDNGEKLLCTDIDTELADLPYIEEAAVIYADKKLVAALRPASADTDPETLRAQIDRYNEQQPIQRKIRDILIVPTAFPRTSSGKLLRRKLEEEYLIQTKKKSL